MTNPEVLDVPSGLAKTEPPALPASPIAMLDHMVKSGYKSDELKGMMDLVERWEANEARKAFQLAMAQAQAEMPLILTDAENKHTGSRYADLGTITKLIKPVYTKHGLSLSFTTEESKLAEHTRIACDVGHQQGHIVRFHMDVPLDGKGSKGGASSMNACQASGSTISYGRRYLTCMIFNLTIADEDTDGAGSKDFLNDTQIDQINGLFQDLHNLGAPINLPKYLKWLGNSPECDALEKVPMARFEVGLNDLRRRKIELEAKKGKS